MILAESVTLTGLDLLVGVGIFGALAAVVWLIITEVRAVRRPPPIGMPEPGSAALQSSRRHLEHGTVTHIVVLGEWGEPEGYAEET